jgi:membrane protein implicated in regulation of membrane protease activity
MKALPAMMFLGVGTLVTALTTYTGVTPTIELQLLLFINISVLLAILLRKRPGFPQWLQPRKKLPVKRTKTFSNTSWFVTNKLGLRKLSPEASGVREEEKGTGNSDIGEIVSVVETIEPSAKHGKVVYKGKKWQAISSSRVVQGETARIIGRDILTLIVEKIDCGSDSENGTINNHS